MVFAAASGRKGLWSNPGSCENLYDCGGAEYAQFPVVSRNGTGPQLIRIGVALHNDFQIGLRAHHVRQILERLFTIGVDAVLPDGNSNCASKLT